MNLVMPRLDGIATTAAIREELPAISLLILTSVLDDERLIAAVRAGAVGYLLKDTGAEELRHAIQAAAAGQVHFAPAAVARLLQEVRTPESAGPLTPRETEVLRLLARGYSNKAIAAQLEIGEQTVKTHIRNLLHKLQVPSRTQAAVYAVRTGLIDPAREE